MEKFPNHIILFDGVCNLCNGAVKFVSRRDKHKIFHFASLQSLSGQALLKKYGLSTDDLDTFVYIKDGRHFIRSKAGLMVLSDLGGIWKFFSILKFLPAIFLDFIYNKIAKNRYRIFGKKNQCTMMEIDLEERILK
ncbi:MAG TPA: DCC1-like thiol-disulfide oxidoreductase family protein [Bacteroidales bacterium]